MTPLLISLIFTAALLAVAWRFGLVGHARKPQSRTEIPSLCSVGIHSFRNVSVHYTSQTLIAPMLITPARIRRFVGKFSRVRPARVQHFHRMVIRTTVDKCQRCPKERTEVLTRRVAKDWSYPERLFPKVET